MTSNLQKKGGGHSKGAVIPPLIQILKSLDVQTKRRSIGMR